MVSFSKGNCKACLIIKIRTNTLCCYFCFYFIVVPALVQSVEGTLVNMSDGDQHRKLCENSELLGDKVKMIKSALKRPAGINIGLFLLIPG